MADNAKAGVTTYLDSGVEYRHPDWFVLDADGPHSYSVGLNRSKTGYVAFCANDGHPWPCPTVQARRGRCR